MIDHMFSLLEIVIYCVPQLEILICENNFSHNVEKHTICMLSICKYLLYSSLVGLCLANTLERSDQSSQYSINTTAALIEQSRIVCTVQLILIS